MGVEYAVTEDAEQLFQNARDDEGLKVADHKTKISVQFLRASIRSQRVSTHRRECRSESYQRRHPSGNKKIWCF